MKKQLIIGALLVLLILVAAVLPVAAKGNKVKFEGVAKSAPVPPLDFGDCIYPDGREHCRGFVVLGEIDVTDDRLNGVETVTMNWNFRLVPPPVLFTGPWWGTSQIVNNNGYWNTTITGGRDEQGIGHIRVVAHGHGGYEGLKAFFTGSRVSPDPTTDFIISGYILEPGNY